MEGKLQLVQLSSTGEQLNVPLVQPRNEDDRLVTSSNQTDRIDADDLVSLATQLNNARQLVKGRTCDRLRQIAQQMEQLHMAARTVLEEAERDEALHNVPCNMQKIPGRVYHLYERRPEMEKYFSLLAPNEWGQQDKIEGYLGSFRLEYDRSWTPIDEVEKKDEGYARIQAMLARGKQSQLSWGY